MGDRARRHRCQYQDPVTYLSGRGYVVWQQCGADAVRGQALCREHLRDVFFVERESRAETLEDLEW